tara:strand:- start:36 stop:509 length:474 start_codon:yes stop_codon:yes gene_type:complete
MNKKYINIYNSLINLTRNKKLYNSFTNQDTFSDRMVFLLLHFSFFLKAYKNDCSKETLQDVFDYFFKQIDNSIREMGYGDTTINKKMKNYINLFYNMLNEVDKWEGLDKSKQEKILNKFIHLSNNTNYIASYFSNYLNYLKNNPFNSLLKGVINPKF